LEQAPESLNAVEKAGYLTIDGAARVPKQTSDEARHAAVEIEK
jgi:hypothetical protein